MSMFEREKLYDSNFNDWYRSPKMVLRVEKKLFVFKQPIPPDPPADSKYLRSGMRFMMLIMRSMFEREKLYDSNFNDWYRSPKMVLRVEKKLFVIEQPIPPAPPADSKYLRSGMRFMMLIMRLMFEREKLYDSNFNDWYRSPKMVLRVEKKLFVIEQPIPPAPPADSKYLLSGMRFMMLIMRYYNMHNMGKTIGELHALLIEYERGLPKKVATPQVMAIQNGRIHKANKKSLNTKDRGKGKGKGKDKSYIPKPKNPKPYAKEHPTKDYACHHCK
ncbi:hypothetical protein Tco_0026312 [Tanacetum coccineum]